MAYRELPTTGPLLACLWINDGDDRTHRILPDACVDIVSVNGRLHRRRARHPRAPHDRRRRHLRRALPRRRRRRGARPARRRAARPQRAARGRLGRRRRRSRTCTSSRRRCSSAAAKPTRSSAPPPPARRAHAIGIGDRQLRRRFLDAVGYGPKTLERILRFQRFLMLEGTDLARLALDAGYADQAHLTRECTRLAGPAAGRAAGRGRRARRREVRFVQDGRASARPRWRHEPRRRTQLPARQRPRPRAPPLRAPLRRRTEGAGPRRPTRLPQRRRRLRPRDRARHARARPASPSASRPRWRSCTRSASTTTR